MSKQFQQEVPATVMNLIYEVIKNSHQLICESVSAFQNRHLSIAEPPACVLARQELTRCFYYILKSACTQCERIYSH